MSRSRKRPFYNMYSKKYTKWAKRQANKVVRKFKSGLSDGKFFKNLYCSWNIRDQSGKYTPDDPEEYRK